MIERKLSSSRCISLISVVLSLLAVATGCGSHPVTGTTIVSQLRLTADSSSVNAGTTTQLHATSTNSDNQTSDVTLSVSWSSSSPTVAAVSPSGVLTGVTAGNATITASLNGISASMPEAIGAPAVTGLVLSPSSTAMFTNGTQTFTALATYANNTTGDASSGAQWSISPVSVATITGGGVVTAVAPGTFTVTASAGTLKADGDRQRGGCAADGDCGDAGDTDGGGQRDTAVYGDWNLRGQVDEGPDEACELDDERCECVDRGCERIGYRAAHDNR